MAATPKILVLNADYQPINVTSFQKGYKLIWKGKAEVVKEDPTDVIMTSRSIARPKVIRLLTYLYLPYRRLNLSKQNVYRRDGFRCVYCGSGANLTLDHVLPRSRGGDNSWENLVTCCRKCNAKKDDLTPEEARMRMRHKPFVPTFSHLIEVEELEYSVTVPS
jgi:5-methylcytosine-specific restriction endonuclease McrA